MDAVLIGSDAETETHPDYILSNKEPSYLYDAFLRSVLEMGQPINNNQAQSFISTAWLQSDAVHP